MPKVSVIVPNYNHEKFLVQRIDSILNQTFQDFEVILLDDNSTDKSTEIFEKYQNHPKIVHVVVNGINSGSVFQQWIKGVNLSKGNFIWIAESDDYADETFLDETLKMINSRDGLGMVFTDTRKVNQGGISLGLVSESKKTLRDLSLKGGVIDSSNVTIYLLKRMVIVNASSVLFTKKALLDIDFEVLGKFINTGDTFVYIGIALKYDVLFLASPLNYMRLHDSNTTKKNKKNGRIYNDKLLMLDHYLEDFKIRKNANQDVVDFVKGIIFLSIDFGHIKNLKSVLLKMYKNDFLEEGTYRLHKKNYFLL